MKNIRLIPACCVMAFIHFCAAGATPAAATVPPKELAGLEFLAGGVWQGDLDTNGSAAGTKIEMEFTWSSNHRALRFDSFFVHGASRRPYSSGLYAWDPVLKLLRIVYSDDEGNLSEGPVAVEGGVFVHNLTVQQATGTATAVRARLEPLAADSFTNTIFLPKDGGWTKLVAVAYRRRNSRAN